MKRIGKKVAILLAVMALTGGYVHTASMTAQVTAASPEELQKSAWEKLLANNAGALTEEEKNSLNQVFNNISAWDQYIRLYSTYTQVIGGDNHAVDSNSIQGRAVYGGNHQYTRDAAATLGQQGNNFGTNSVVVGYQPSAFGENSIAMGTGATTFPIKYGENFAGYANAIGADAWSGDMGNAFGAGAVAMGQGSVAIGTMAVAGSPDIQKYISRNKYEYQPYFEQLQKAYPNIFGETQPNESVTERSERMGQQIFAEYSSYFKKIGIPDFATFKTRVSQWEAVLQKLGWHMALSKDARHHVTALGFGATATATGGVALGAFSEADRGTVTEKAPFSEFELTNQNTLGAVSVGNKTFLRQLINVADGTEATDAVNLRQLKALNKKVDGKKDIHFFSVQGSSTGNNYHNDGAIAGYTTAVGPDAMATEENSQAFGYRARAIGHSSIVFGVESTASGARDIAIGYGSHAVGSDNTNTSWNDTIAIGWNALSRGGSFASGTGAVAGGSGSVALGAGAYVGTKWLDDETQKAQNVNKWVLTRSFLDKGLRDELKAKFPEKFAEWEQRAGKMPAAMGSEYLEQKLRTLAMEQLPQMTSPSMKNTMKDMESSIAIGRRTKVYSASAIAIGSEAKVGENLDGAIALGNQSLATRNAGIFGYDPTSDAKTWTDFKKAHPEAGIGVAREQEIQREMNALSDEVAQMGPTYQAWEDKGKYPDKYLDERKAYAESHGNTLNGNNEWVEWVLHARNEQQKLWNKGQELTNKYNNLQKELNGGANLGKGAWIGNKAALAIGNEEDGVTRQITGVAAGTKDTDAVNVAQLKVLNTKVDKVAANSGVHYFSVNSSETGEGSNYNNDGAKGVHAVAIGAYATADSAGGVALGRDSTAKREGGLFGYNPKNGAAFVDGTAVAEYLGKTTEYDALQTEMTAKKKAVEEAKKALKENAADTTKKENLNKAYQALEAVQQKENLLLGAYRSASGYGAFSVGNEEKGITRQITGVAAGTKDTDAVNVAQLKALEKKVGTAGKDGKSAYEIWRDHTVDGKQPNKDKSEQEFLDSLKGKNGKDGEKGKDGVNGTKGTDGKNGTNGKSAYEIWRDHEENGTQPNKDKSEQEFLDSLKGKDGKDGTGADIDIQGNDTGIVVVDKKTDTAGKTKYTLGLGTKIKAGEVTIDGTKDKENVVVGDVKINGEKGHGTVTGLSNTTWDEKHVVSGRAATEDQLQAVSQKNRQAISELGTQLERGTASAAALAALHPQEFDPADKWDFAVGYSNYRSANTFAFGGFYRPNERTLVSLGGTFGGENIVNVGLSFKTGKGSDGISTSRIAMAREIQALKEQDAAKARIMQELLQVQKKKEAEIQALKEK
ncbi:YadA-like family protein, partial [uncultured Megasphaera sp.]|uniref:YadA-like family protein n=1 Tax=uncultured Megasphaera sp. TaxID=165188 RepID=UPI00259889B5